MSGLRAIARGIDFVNEWIGRVVSWFTVFMVLITVVVVVLRYGFDTGFIWMQESVRYLHTFVFLLCAGYTFLHNGHVRVDILYQRMSERGRAIVDVVGSILFMIPVCVAIIYFSWGYVVNSWADFEGSIEVRGIHAVFILKTCIWLFAGLMILQALSRIIHCIAIIQRIEHETADEDTHGV